MSESPEKNNTKQRPPIVVVMGHVDHGKTTLLDYIRKTNVAAREAGGITQSIGAYEITHGGRRITFIDTPGHEAFSKMRSRGARIADLAILVVAADESLKPQTIESIKILEETKTPFVVAITKIDKPGADMDKVKNDLMGANVFLEGCGGCVSYQPVSAKSGDHVNELLDLLLLAADMENLGYDPDGPASGFVLEAKMDHRRGIEATVIVTDGALKQGSLIATKTANGKIKILENFMGKPAKELEPSAPALIIGFDRLPVIGEEFSSGKMIELLKAAVSSEPRAAAADNGTKHLLRVILKSSDSGSLEALYEITRSMAMVKSIKIVGDAVGDVRDNDIKLAISTDAMIVAFKSRVDKAAKTLAEANKINIVSSEIIYDLIKSMEAAIAEREKPTSLGEMEILAVFNKSRLDKQVIGGKITHGTIRARSSFEITRGGCKVGNGKINNLQQQKKDVSQASEGEIGLMVGACAEIEVGDKIIIAQ